MEVLQWVLLIGISMALISIVFFSYLLFSFLLQKRTIAKLPQRKSRNKRKRRKEAKERAELLKRRNRTLRNAIIFFLLSIVFGGGSYYVTYYQATNLTTEDASNITEGYYYLDELENELATIENDVVDAEKSKQTLNYLATSLAAYGAKSSSTLNTVEGQTVLNRYYLSMSEVGLNISRQTGELMLNKELVKEIQGDLEKVLANQKKVFNYFKVNEGALKAQR